MGEKQRRRHQHKRPMYILFSNNKNQNSRQQPIRMPRLHHNQETILKMIKKEMEKAMLLESINSECSDVQQNINKLNFERIYTLARLQTLEEIKTMFRNDEPKIIF